MPSGQGLTVTFAEEGVREGDSPTLQVDGDGGWYITRKIKLDTVGNTATAIAQILGYSTRNGNRISRYLPERDPNFPFVWADKIISASGRAWKQKSVTLGCDDPMTGPAYTNEFKKSLIHFSLRDRSYDLKTDEDTYAGGTGSAPEFKRFVSEEIEEGGDFLTMPTGAMKWTAEKGFLTGLKSNNVGKPVPLQPAKALYSSIITWTWHEIPEKSVPWERIRLLKGTVNDRNFVGQNGIEYPAHTLLFLGSRIAKRTRNPIGEYHRRTLEYKVKYQPWGHTRFFDYDVDNQANPIPPNAAQVTDFFRVTVDGKDYTVGTNPIAKWVTDESNFYDLFTPV